MYMQTTRCYCEWSSHTLQSNEAQLCALRSNRNFSLSPSSFSFTHIRCKSSRTHTNEGTFILLHGWLSAVSQWQSGRLDHKTVCKLANEAARTRLYANTIGITQMPLWRGEVMPMLRVPLHQFLYLHRFSRITATPCPSITMAMAMAMEWYGAAWMQCVCIRVYLAFCQFLPCTPDSALRTWCALCICEISVFFGVRRGCSMVCVHTAAKGMTFWQKMLFYCYLLRVGMCLWVCRMQRHT